MYGPHNVTVITVTETNGTTERSATYLQGVLLDSHAGGALYKGGIQSADSATLFIPQGVQASDLFTGQPREYKTPDQYINQPDKSRFWTLLVNGKMSGCDCYIVRGRLDPRERLDYATLRKNGYEVYRVANCDNRDFGSSGMRHWQVGLT